MYNDTEFDSEFCHVRYMESDGAVFLTWKKFARLDDYRRPTAFTLELLGRYPGSCFIVDARDGFEDDPADVEWGFSWLLPHMAEAGCRTVAFILRKVSDIEGEMDMWTKEFARYFAVVRAESYEQAVRKVRSRVLACVRYAVKPGKRAEFLQAMQEQDIVRASRAEPGNARYEVFLPAEEENALFLFEEWTDAHAQSAHAKTPHYGRLTALKQAYVTDVAIEKFAAEAVG